MKTKQLLLTLLLLSAVSAGRAQIARDVHWIHGLGGGTSSWESTANLFFNERLINTAIRGDYETGQGAGEMATRIRTASLPNAGNNLIGIAHSMGGVGIRQIDVNNTGHFGAIITFGSPLRGARIVNAISGGETNSYVANGISKLERGPLAQVGIIMPRLLGINVTDWLANEIVGGIVAKLSLRNQTIPDLSEESGYNQAFYGSGTPTPKLMMWGDEDSPVHVRLAASFKNMDENNVVTAWDDARYFYGFMEEQNRIQGYLPWNFIARWQANEWQVGHEYMFSQSEGQWRAMIGASFVQTYPITYWGPTPGATEQDFWYCADNNLFDGDCPYNQLYTGTTQIFTNTPTDGVVPVRSQIAENTAWRPNDPNFIRRLGGDNHQSMRSSDAGRNELRSAFEGNFGNQFRIDLR